MANNKKVTVDQLSQVVKGAGRNNDARFLKLSDKGALATKNSVAKSDLTAELSTEISGKANSATSLAGYNIADAYTKTEVDTSLAAKADSATTLAGYNIADAYTKTQVDTSLAAKADTATTISGYGITDAYTKAEVDAKITATYKPKGSLAASSIAASLLVAANEGNVYNVTEAFTTTADFVEGAGKTHPAGSNIVVVNTAAANAAAVYKFDVLAGMVDLSNYATLDDVEAATSADITAIINGQYEE